jgi:hypothetical protein
MGYTAAEIINIADRLLVDIDDDAYSDDMLSYFNEWQRRFATETHCVQKITDVTASLGFASYSRIADEIGSTRDIVHVFQVQLVTGSVYLPKANISDLRTLPGTSVSTPTRYWIFGKRIILDVDPSIMALQRLEVKVSTVPADLTSVDQETQIPDEWAQAGVQYLCYCARLSDRDAGLANGHFADYDSIRMQAALLYKSQLES